MEEFRKLRFSIIFQQLTINIHTIININVNITESVEELCLFVVISAVAIKIR